MVAPRERRREARRAQSRAEILDAAERVFGEDGIRDGSVRRIATLSGYSAGAVYLFFENKADLLATALARRGDEWSATVRSIASGDAAPVEKLHQTVDFAATLFAEHPHFRQLLGQVSRGSVIAGHSLATPDQGDDDCFTAIMADLTGIIEEGQVRGDIRAGDPRSLAHLFSMLVNEYVQLDAAPGVSRLTMIEFHGFIDGALRAKRSHVR